MDALIGERPLDRMPPEDYTLGPVQELSEVPTQFSDSAAGAAREFLEGLKAAKLSAAASGSKDVLAFLLSDFISGSRPVVRWRMGAGVKRPEGGYSFPVLLDTDSTRSQGEVLVGYSQESGWGVELVLLNTEVPLSFGAQARGTFDPTIRAPGRP